MGGPVPLGYQSKDRQLIIHEEEAKDVKLIYELYLEHGTVRELKRDTDQRNLNSGPWTTKSGDKRGGQPYSRGHLYRILTNPIYIGKVSHRGQLFERVHQRIIDEELWHRVQDLLKGQAAKVRSHDGSKQGLQCTSLRCSRSNASSRTKVVPSPLIGKLFDETGDRLTPSHATKKGKRYRYYVSNRLIKQEGGVEDKGGWRLAELAVQENRTIRQIQRHLELAFLSPTLIQKIVVGLQPPEMTSRHLVTSTIPIDWNQQHQLLGV